jgi:chlorophyll synthase
MGPAPGPATTGQRAPPAAAGQRARPADLVVALWRMARPPIWLVSLVPLWIGNLLATRTIVPDDAGVLTLATLVFGPMAWAAALFINDVHDLAGDRRNPRKQDTPLVRGAVSLRFVRRSAYGSAAIALAAAAAVSVAFCAVTAIFLVLAWAYSVPPVRLKTRPGADVLVNAVGVGVLPLLAGWSATQPLASFPWVMIVQGFVVAVALYLPTTLVDRAADAAAGYNTFATRLGARAAYRLGVAAWTAANAGGMLLAAFDVVLPRVMLPLLAVTAPALVLAYHLLIGRARGPAQTIRGIILISWLFLVPNAIFAAIYTGVWSPGG